MSVLEMKNTCLHDSGTEIIKDINFSIEKGTITGLLGNPGCGKSTVLKLLAGLIIPSSGNVYFEGKDIHKMNHQQNLEFRKKAAFVFQDSALWANQDIFHNLELPLQTHFPKMTAAQRKERIQEAAEKVGYKKPLTNRPAALSNGEQKKISFARAIICNPDILFLDEPTESLESEAKDDLFNFLREFNNQQKTIIFVSHDNYFISSFFCDKIYLDNGKIVKKEIFNEMLI